MIVLVAAGAAAGAASGALPDANATALDRYLDGLKSLRTAFTQTVTNARGIQTEAGAGTLVVLRPGKFRWDYQPRAAAAATGTADAPPATDQAVL
jgi:outer membrane lipoprotein-sorting protein